jgi:hypothetical protein
MPRICYHFTYNWHSTFIIQVPNSITVEFLLFISYNTQQMLKMSSSWINTRTDTSDHDLSHPLKCPRAIGNGSIDIQNALVKCPFISNWSWMHGFKFPHRSKSKGLRSTSGWNVPRLPRTSTDMNFYLVWGTHSWSLSKHCRYALYSNHCA